MPKKNNRKDKKTEKKREKINEKKKAPVAKASKKTAKKTSTKKTEAKRANARIPKDAVTRTNRNMVTFGFGIILLALFALMFRMGYWQIVRADELRVMATEMQKVDTEIDPNRGAIYDSNMNILAESVTEYELYAYSQNLYKTEELTSAIKASNLKIMREATGKSEEELIKILNSEENLVMVADGLSKEQVDIAREAFDSNVVVKTKISRYYPNGAFAAQALGGVDSNNVGRSGLEYQYNTELAGV